MSIPIYTEEISTIWGSSSDDVFAIGSNARSGVVLHFNGNGWEEVPFSGIDYDYFISVWGIPGRYFFVRYNSLSQSNESIIVEYDGQYWSDLHTVAPGQISDVWGISQEDVYAVGYRETSDGVQTTIMHFDGEVWSEMENNFSTALYSVWGSSSTDVFAVGAEGDRYSLVGTILHYNGNSWSVMEENVPYRLVSISGSSEDNVYAAGTSGILRYDGIAWAEITDIGSLDIWVGPNSEVFMFGGDPVRYSDGNWDSPCSISHSVKNEREYYFGIWGVSKEDVFLVGASGKAQSASRGMILRSNFIDDLNCFCE